MSIKTTILAITSSFAIMANAGLYFVSGGDFRTSNIKYTMETTEPNQTVDVTPGSVFLLSNYGNAAYASEWSIKTDGDEFTYDNKANIRIQESRFKNGCYNATPHTHSYSRVGKHLVKLHDELNNIYQIEFTNMNELTSLSVDWRNISSVGQYGNLFKVTIKYCPLLEDAFIGFPENANPVMNGNCSYIMNAKNVVITHPETIKSLAQTFQHCGMTNDAIFASVTNIGNSCFDGALGIKKALFPNVQSIGSRFFNLSTHWSSTLQDWININPITGEKYLDSYPDYGLEELTIGDKITFIGQNAFYKQDKLKVINFVCDDVDWVATWNANKYFRIFLGKAAPVEGDATTTTLSYDADVEVTTAEVQPLTARSGLPRPTTLNVIRRNQLQ